MSKNEEIIQFHFSYEILWSWEIEYVRIANFVWVFLNHCKHFANCIMDEYKYCFIMLTKCRIKTFWSNLFFVERVYSVSTPIHDVMIYLLKEKRLSKWDLKYVTQGKSDIIHATQACLTYKCFYNHFING